MGPLRVSVIPLTPVDLGFVDFSFYCQTPPNTTTKETSLPQGLRDPDVGPLWYPSSRLGSTTP